MTPLEIAVRITNEVPNPGAGSQPPGFEKFVDIMGWAKWLCLGIAVVALMGAGAMMSIQSKRGQGDDHAGAIGKVLVGVLTISGAFSLVGFLAT